MRSLFPWVALAGVLALTWPLRACGQTVTLSDPDGALARTGAPVSCRVTLNERQIRAGVQGRLGVRDGRNRVVIPAQFEPSVDAKTSGRIWWMLPPGERGTHDYRLVIVPKPMPAAITASLDGGSGQVDVKADGRPLLRYNYRTIEVGSLVDRVAPGDRIYARSRSDYIHPLFGPSGEEMTKDWAIDHPHHRGIYWAWPEVEYKGEQGDLHALQRVFARPTGTVATRSGPVYAEVEAENVWRWEDKEPIVREKAIVRAYVPGREGRWIDLILKFEALRDGISLARRHTDLYGGLNIRLAAVKDQQIVFHTDSAPPLSPPDSGGDKGGVRQAWADLSGTFAGATAPAGLTVLQNRRNPDYPGDWVKYPELNWFQPTFPAPKTRYGLKVGQPLTLRYRLWIHAGASLPESVFLDQWKAYDLAEQQ